MRKALIFTMLLLTVITATIIIMIGCGGDDTTTVPNIYTPTPAPGRTAYITVQVKWPSRGEEGSYTISSGDEKSVITERMPEDSRRIEITIFEPNHEDNILGHTSLAVPETKKIVQIFGKQDDPDPNTAHPIPVIKVIVKAESYDQQEGGNLISKVQKEYDVKVSNNPDDNTVNLNLGKYKTIIKEAPNLYIAKSHKIVVEVMVRDQNTLLLPAKDKKVEIFIKKKSNSQLLYTATGITGEDGTCNTEVMLPEPLSSTGVGNATIDANAIIDFSDTKNRGTVIYGDSCDIKVIGKYNMAVFSSPKNINIYKEKDRNSNIEPPKFGAVTVPAGGTATPYPTATAVPLPTFQETPSSEEEVLISANLRIIYPEVAPEPNTVYEPPPPVKYVEGKEVKFTISGPGELLSDRAITNKDGYATVSMRPTGTGYIYIRAEFQADPSDAGSICYATCTVYASITHEYTMTMNSNPYNLDIIPDFESDYFKTVNKSTIGIKLARPNPVEGSPPIDLTGKEVKLTITGRGQLSSQSVYTDGEGKCSVELTGFDDASGDIKIKGECVIDPNRPPLACTLTVPVNNHIIDNVDFENYSTGTTAESMDNHTQTYLTGRWFSYSSGVTASCITDTIANNGSKSLLLYGAPDLTYYEQSTEPYHWHHPSYVSGMARIISKSPPPNEEFRFSIRNGSETLEHANDILVRDGQRYRAIFEWHYVDVSILFRDDNSIIVHKDVIGSYSPGVWYNIKIQFIANERQVIYWINGNKVKTASMPYDEYYYNTRPMRDPMFTSEGGSIWIDDIYLYDLNRLPKK